MKKEKIISLLLAAAAVILLVGNVFFFVQSRKPEYDVLIGTPIRVPEMDRDGNEIGSTTGTDFTKSKPLNQDQINTVLLAFIEGNSAEQPELSEPDAVMLLGMENNGTEYGYWFRLWLKENSVVYAIGAEKDLQYKEITTPYYVEALTAIVEGQIGG